MPLPSGDYLVRLDSGSPYAMSARGVPLTIASPPVSRFITFQLEPANTATVHVVNGTGASVPGACLTASDGGVRVGEQASCDNFDGAVDGYVHFRYLPAPWRARPSRRSRPIRPATAPALRWRSASMPAPASPTRPMSSCARRWPVDDVFRTAQGLALDLDVLANDSDADGEPFQITDHTTPGHGSVVLDAAGHFSYTPDADYVGSDTFSYTITDTEGAGATATVTINVQGPGVLVRVLDPAGNLRERVVRTHHPGRFRDDAQPRLRLVR